MEYLAKKSFSFLQDFAFISINNETCTNKWNISRKSRFLFCKILHLLVKAFKKNIYRFIYFSLVYFFAKNSFISTSKVFYKLCKYVNSHRSGTRITAFVHRLSLLCSSAVWTQGKSVQSQSAEMNGAFPTTSARQQVYKKESVQRF